MKVQVFGTGDGDQAPTLSWPAMFEVPKNLEEAIRAEVPGIAEDIQKITGGAKPKTLEIKLAVTAITFDASKTFCKRCGTANPPDLENCDRCGLPMYKPAPAPAPGEEPE